MDLWERACPAIEREAVAIQAPAVVQVSLRVKSRCRTAAPTGTVMHRSNTGLMQRAGDLRGDLISGMTAPGGPNDEVLVITQDLLGDS
ncbi:hypothetical protein D3C79_915780 [compost metagenome]